MLKLIYISEGLRMFRRSIKVRLKGTKKYKGNAEQICRQIVKDCWNGRYFQVSTGHFCEFYIRDFGWCIDSLLKLGYQEEVAKTLDYALNIYSKHGKITTTISPKGIPFNFPDRYAPDSLAFMIYSLSASNAKDLVKKYHLFLNKEIERFSNTVIGPDGLVKKNIHFSSMKDHAIRNSSCYDNVMAASLSKNLSKLGLNNPFKKYNYKKLIIENLWNGRYFLDDCSGKDYVAGDANVFPFHMGIIEDKNKLKSCIEALRKNNLDKPVPLKYNKKEANIKLIAIDFLSSNYETESAWTHMGPLYVSLVKKIDKKLAEEYITKYTELIEKYRNFLEGFIPNGKPFKSPFYYADEGMLWAANYLTLR
ncbi:hypothetical protein KY345_05230 [Candidatus Woesearchaeota archaeon]|nr:hypothetical protein [Candidatus Woesearchaeota archaeon]